MTALDLEVFLTPGLGDCTFLLASGDEAVIVDPQRDAGRFVRAAELRHLRIRYVLETHVHNDYVSGALEIRASTGAEIAAPARGGYSFPVLGVDEGDELRVGDLRLVAIATPGHTPEHTSYGVMPAGSDAPVALLSGGSLLVGTAGRTDLLGMDRAAELAEAQFGSLRRLAELPDEALVLPTHGAGSFCASGTPEEARTSTIGHERVANPAFASTDREAFVRRQLANLPAFPTYYAHMAPINRAGPVVVRGVPLPSPLDVEDVERWMQRGARVVDARGGAEFAGAHIPGSLSVPLDESFGSYVGWLVPFDSSIVLVAGGKDVHEDIAVQLFRIGYERIVGYLHDGIEAWDRSGRPLDHYAIATLEDLASAARSGGGQILDVRQRREWDEGHLPGSRHCFVADVPSSLEDLRGPDELLVACVSGFRASIAASLLHDAGIPVRLVAEDGIPEALSRL